MAVRYAVAALLAAALADGFVLPRTPHKTVLKATKNDPERQKTLDEAKRILARAANTPVEADQGLGGAVTGALVGSFLLGPLGMLMGASVGSNVGQAASAKKQMEQRLASLGVDDEVIRNVGEASRDLAEADESRGYVQSALESASAFAASARFLTIWITCATYQRKQMRVSVHVHDNGKNCKGTNMGHALDTLVGQILSTVVKRTSAYWSAPFRRHQHD